MAHINSDILRLGVDVGSTTVKAVALDPADNSVLFTRYQRHNAHQADTVRALETYGETYPNAVEYCNRTISIPMHPYLEESVQEEIVKAVLETL